MPRVIAIALVVFATIYALVDCLQTDGRRLRIMPKAVWLLVCLIPVAGPALWLVAGRSAAPGSGRQRFGSWGSPPQRPMPPPGPRGPDDDPDFLWKLRKPKS